MNIFVDVNNIILISATAVVILLLKKILKGKVTPKLQLGIWIILLMQVCLLPIGDLIGTTAFVPKSNVSIQNYVPQIKESSLSEISYGEDKITMVIPATDSTVFSEVPAMKYLGQSYEGAFYFIWKVGALFMAILFIISYCKLRLKCRRYECVEDLKIIETLIKCKSSVGVTRNITLKQGVKTPFLAGLINPTIYISDDFDREELNYIFTHELCHYKHKDLLINMLAAGLLCLMWYNPLMWVCFAVIRRDLEIYCDYRAVEILGERKEYAKVLLKAAAGKKQFTLATTSFANGEKEISERISNISRFKKPSIVAIVLGVIVVIIVAIFLLTGGNEDLNKNSGGIVNNAITLEDFQYKAKDVQSAVIDLIDNSLMQNVKAKASGENALKNYKINSINKVDPLMETPSPEGDGTFYANQARWDILYPGTKVMAVNYDLLATDGGVYNYKEYAVFTQMDFLREDKRPTIKMLGFISQNELEQHSSLDEAIFFKIHKWYREDVEPFITEKFHTPYLGNPSAVLKVVEALPLHQLIDTKEGTFTDKGLVLQTTTEPYGLTINYYSEDPLYSLTPDGENLVNHFVESQIESNANILFKSIDNLGTVTINLICERDEPKSFKYEFGRQGQ